MGLRLDRAGVCVVADMSPEREARLRAAMMDAAPKPSLKSRLDWLEADASAQRTAILRLERKINMLAGAVALAGIVALAFKIALEVLT
jgi:hypothetical protein